MSVRGYLGMAQLEFAFRTWGGKRRGAGRKPAQGKNTGVSHAQRPEHRSYHPLHLTLRVAVKCLRKELVFKRIVAAIRAVNHSRGDRFRVVEFSVQWDHLHLVVEALDKQNVGNGVKALCSRITHAVHRLLGRRGALFPQRYHQQVLATPRAVRSVLIYVLGNFRKHGTEEARMGLPLDPFSSAPTFTGFSGIFGAGVGRILDDSAVAPAQTWLLSHGWRRCGLIPVEAQPSQRTH